VPGAGDARRSFLTAATPEVVLLDVEGTTTPVSFVYDVLFPLAQRRLGAFLDELGHDADAKALEGVAGDVLAEREREADPGAPTWREEAPRASAEAYLLWLMERDRKSTALKAVQGRIWERAFLTGELRGQVYPDVRPALERWTRAGRRVAIFSSGSILAQRLLFRHSTAGDLTPLLTGHFDTTTGPKREPDSYARIARALAAPPARLLFVSDVEAELDAARSGGLATALCVREGPLPADSRHPAIRDLSALL